MFASFVPVVKFFEKSQSYYVILALRSKFTLCLFFINYLTVSFKTVVGCVLVQSLVSYDQVAIHFAVYMRSNTLQEGLLSILNICSSSY